MARADPPDSLQLETEYAAVLWPEDLALLRLLQEPEQRRKAQRTSKLVLPSIRRDLLNSLAAAGRGVPEARYSLAAALSRFGPAVYADVPTSLDPSSPPEPGLTDLPEPPAPDAFSPRTLEKSDFVRRLLNEQQERRHQGFILTSQQDVISRPVAARLIVDAGPGTGKTWTLIERIIALTESGQTAPEDIQVLCYSRAAQQVATERLRQAAEEGRLAPSWVDVSINTLDSYAARMLLFLQEEEPSWLPCAPQSVMSGSYDDTMRRARAALKRHPEIVRGLRHLIVDEMQDIVDVRASFLLTLTDALDGKCGFTYFGDSCQAIYDYSVGAGGTTSARLYDRLLKGQPEAARLTFDENRRSRSDIARLSIPYRKAILSGESRRLQPAARAIRRACSFLEVPWDAMDLTVLRDLSSEGTLGLLTRSNGEALAVATALQEAGLPHELLVAGAKERLGSWIGRLLMRYDGQTMDVYDFADSFAALYPEADPEPYWNALVELQRRDRERYEIRDLLRPLAFSGSWDTLAAPPLFDSPDEKHPPIRVMTVHKAKGREFDSVLIPSKLLEKTAGSGKTPTGNEEHRVAYVALTRARRTLGSFQLPEIARSLKVRRLEVEEQPDRWYRRTRYGMRYFEIGAAEDLDPKSFAEDPAQQEFLLTHGQSMAGMELGLERLKDTLAYQLADRDTPGQVLGTTSTAFTKDLQMLLAPTSRHRVPLLAPDAFRSIYVRRLATFTAPAAEAPAAARRYGDMAVWLGLDVMGLAQAVYFGY
ncbi:MAG: ATP-dependent helicase [Clostridia bacterium]|nr:ATP-dependent helicase [Clostridia bacterium]